MYAMFISIKCFVMLFYIFFVVVEEDMKTVEKNVNKKSLNTYYEASIISEKLKKAYCYISPRVSRQLWFRGNYACTCVLAMWL